MAGTHVEVGSSIDVDRAAGEVFSFVADPTNDVKWHHNVISAEKLTPGPLAVGSRFKWDARFFGRRPTDIVITRYEPDRFVAMDLTAGWMKATVSYTVEPLTGSRSRVTRTVAMPRPRATRPFDRIVARFAARSGRHHVEWLQAALEGRPPPADGHHHH